MRKHAANIVTSFRILFAAAMAAAAPFSAVFWGCYCLAVLSDFLDGFIARKMHIQSETGSKLDSAADMVFAVAIAVTVIRNIQFPTWLWRCILCAALLRVSGYAIGFFKYRTFTSLHTYANKATGAALSAAPILYIVMGLTAAGIILCTIAILSALEEVAIIICSKELNRDCRSLLQLISA